MKRLFALVLFALCIGAAQLHADSADDQYVRIYNTIQEGDAFNNAGRYADALTKYSEAQLSLARFKRVYSDWNTRVISFRMNYLTAKIATVTPKVPARPIAAQTAGSAARAKPNANGTAKTAGLSQEQLNTLHGQVRQLQADKILLEAKLKESLSIQPTSSDPRELARAQERIKNLQKETDLLKATLHDAKAQPVADSRVMDDMKRPLADATRKLGEAADKSTTLAAEKTALQNKLNGMEQTAYNAAQMEATKKALDDATRQLAEEKETAAKTAAERDTLLAKEKTLAADSEAASALRMENQIIKKQLADLRAASASPGNVAQSTKMLAEAQAQIAALLSDKDVLRLEKVALEQRLKRVSASLLAQAQPKVVTERKPEDIQRIKLLERDREDLQKRLEAANKELSNRGTKAMSARIVEMENEMALLRARLDVFETRAIPYTHEELALFKRPEITLSADPKPGTRSVKELPAGSVTLVADAQRAFSNRDYDRAEERYLQVLHQDEKNVLTLANLAEIQLERQRFDEAEKHIKQAVALAPDDSYSWFVLGQLKFRQGKYEDALDALSRAAKLDPNNPEIQNILGLTLSEKGMRGPAETALRKAIQIRPGFADAHANLAVVYVTQTPPLIELARWHYQKALDAGAPHNAFLETRLTEQKADASR
jgi:tetratricopeptide (TPR) repeat protein